MLTKPETDPPRQFFSVSSRGCGRCMYGGFQRHRCYSLIYGYVRLPLATYSYSPLASSAFKMQVVILANKYY